MKRPLVIFLLVLLHAVCIALMYPPTNIWPLAFVALAPRAVAAVEARSTWRLVGIVFVVDSLLYGWLQRWTISITQAGFFPLAFYMALYSVLFVAITRRVSRHPRLGTWPSAVTLPVIWTGLEFLRGSVAFHGYPWFELAHPIVEWPILAQSSDLFGTYFSSFLVASVSGLIVDIVRLRRGTLPVRRFAVAATIIIFIQGASIAYGFYRVHQTAPLSPGPAVLAIQTNLPQDNRNAWTPEQQAKDLPGFMNLTRDGLKQSSSKVDLIAWPETLVPGAGFEVDTIDFLWQFGEQANDLYFWPTEVSRFQRQIDIPMIVGSAAWVGPRYKELRDGRIQLESPEHRYNSAYLIQDQPPYQRYDKVFLTPFGETMPYISAWPWLQNQLLSIGASGMSFDLDAAADVRVMTLRTTDHGDVHLGTPICFEDCMARVIRKIVYKNGDKRADLLVNLSNDGWFTWDNGSRAQRVQISRWRCIENRVPLVRSVNTGMSVSVDSVGRIIDVVGAGEYGTGNIAGYILAHTTLDRRNTLYGTIGDTWGWLCLAAGTVTTIMTLKRKRTAQR